MKKNKVCLSARQGFAPIAIVLIVVAVLVVGGVAYYAGKSFKKENNFTSQPAGNDIAQPAVKESTNIVDPDNPNLMTYISYKLGVSFKYLKNGGFSNGQEIKPVENGNEVWLQVFVNSKAYPDHDNYILGWSRLSNETTPEATIRRINPNDFVNKNCVVVALNTTTFRIEDKRFPGKDTNGPGFGDAYSNYSNICYTHFGQKFKIDNFLPWSRLIYVNFSNQAVFAFADESHTKQWFDTISFLK